MSKTPSFTSLAIAHKKEDLAAALVTVTTLRKEIADMRASQRLARTAAKENKIADRFIKAKASAAKKAARIAKLEVKLAAMKNPVGRLAIKAAKKPSKVTVLKMAA